MRTQHEEKYFNWLCDLVYDRKSKTSYNKLLKYLHTKPFTWIIPMDENRAMDGIALRNRFIDIYPNYECDLDRDCSILEMMIALSIRCEDYIMQDDRYGNRTGEWFWNMILSLGLTGMTDTNFNKGFVEEVIFNFITRNYGADGKGGLFTIINPHIDMRRIEIWHQLNWYLEEVPN